MFTPRQVFKITKSGAYVACVNQRYHLFMKTVYGWGDRILRIAVGVLAVFALVYTVSASVPEDPSFGEKAVAYATAFLAIALNVLPVNEWANLHLDFYRRWTHVRERWESLEIDCKRIASESIAEVHMIEEMEALNNEKHRIESDEPRQYQWLMRIFQSQENLRRIGPDGESPKAMFEKESISFFGPESRVESTHSVAS